MGGDTPNEDEYSAALERLLEGCPACTHCSSQIGGTVSKGGALHTEHEEGEAGQGGASGDDWGGRQAGEACMHVCAPLASEQKEMYKSVFAYIIAST